jgi:hypothetical protein
MPLGPLPTGVVQVLNLYLRCSRCNIRPVKVKGFFSFDQLVFLWFEMGFGERNYNL